MSDRVPGKSSPVFLCGFMGVGKTTVGRILSDKLGWPLIDTDQEIVRLAGRSIPEIFQNGGEPAFREFEEQVLAGLEGRKEAVVSLGGGVLGSVRNRDVVARSGLLIYMEAAAETLLERLEPQIESRPLLAGVAKERRREKIAGLLATRRNLYERADIRIQTDGQAPEAVAEAIIEALRGGRNGERA